MHHQKSTFSFSRSPPLPSALPPPPPPPPPHPPPPIAMTIKPGHHHLHGEVLAEDGGRGAQNGFWFWACIHPVSLPVFPCKPIIRQHRGGRGGNILRACIWMWCKCYLGCRLFRSFWRRPSTAGGLEIAATSLVWDDFSHAQLLMRNA